MPSARDVARHWWLFPVRSRYSRSASSKVDQGRSNNRRSTPFTCKRTSSIGVRPRSDGSCHACCFPCIASPLNGGPLRLNGPRRDWLPRLFRTFKGQINQLSEGRVSHVDRLSRNMRAPVSTATMFLKPHTHAEGPRFSNPDPEQQRERPRFRRGPEEQSSCRMTNAPRPAAHPPES